VSGTTVVGAVSAGLALEAAELEVFEPDAIIHASPPPTPSPTAASATRRNVFARLFGSPAGVRYASLETGCAVFAARFGAPPPPRLCQGAWGTGVMGGAIAVMARVGGRAEARPGGAPEVRPDVMPGVKPGVKPGVTAA